jgi:hypothetical protein
MHTLEKLIAREIGAVEIEVRQVLDEHPSFDWIGEYSNYRAPLTSHEKLVDRYSGYVLDHHGIWRNNLGRIVAAPDCRGGREYQYTFHSNGHEKIAYALADHRRMERYEAGDWCFTGILATVTVDGVEIGRASLWGIESDSEYSYIIEVAREMLAEAIGETRAWFARRGAE